MQVNGLPLEALGFLLFCLAGIWAIRMLARQELGRALTVRRGMLDDAASLLTNPRVTIGDDGYPRLCGMSGVGRVSMEVVADSLVPRRLPQLWLKIFLHYPVPQGNTSIGILARPVGTEFYSRVLGLPDTLRPSFKADIPLLMRGRNMTERALQPAVALFRTLLADPAVKEIIMTPGGCGLVRQIAEGDRGAHMLYRQMRFPVEHVSPILVNTALAELDLLDDAFRTMVDPADEVA